MIYLSRIILIVINLLRVWSWERETKKPQYCFVEQSTGRTTEYITTVDEFINENITYIPHMGARRRDNMETCPPPVK